MPAAFNLLLVLCLLLEIFHHPFVTALEVRGNVVTLYNATDVIEFSNEVNNRNSYDGSTVLLGEDIDFSGLSDKFSPIGTVDDILFRGVFDGQGHTISNLVVNSTGRFIGFFGAINGTSFKNVVVDSSCSVLSTYNFTESFGSVGGIIGCALPDVEDPNSKIENCVNMASVTLAGVPGIENKTRRFTASAGGIVGYFVYYNTSSVIRNCVNYGELRQAGLCDFGSVGGVLGSFF